MVYNYVRWLILGCIFLAGCGTPKEVQHAERDLADIKEEGTLRVLMGNNMVSYFFYKGRPLGYEYELAQLLAKELGVNLSIEITTSVPEAAALLQAGKADIIAVPLTPSEEREKLFAFTDPFFTTRQVLVQKLPFDWWVLPRNTREAYLVRSPEDLIGKEVVVLTGSAFGASLKDYMGSTIGDCIIREDSVSLSESLIHQVARGVISYTVSDEHMAKLYKHSIPQVDIKTAISEAYPIVWGLRHTSVQLKDTLAAWQAKLKKKGLTNYLYKKYFEMPRYATRRILSEYSSKGGGRISPYDDLLKKHAKKLGWDWRMLASIMYEESGFDPQAESWVGAQGLMQVMPRTAMGNSKDTVDLFDPEQNVLAAIKHIKFLDRYWHKSVPDSAQRIKFILASYNVGLVHIEDAQILSWKYDRDSSQWDGKVEYYLLKKKEPAYYRDPDIKGGYCKCNVTYNYVKSILHRFDEYRKHLDG